MLPDFHSLKKQLQHKVNKNMRRMVARESGFVGTISNTRCFEGDRNKIVGSDRKIIQDNPFHEASATFQVPLQLVNQIGPNEIQKRLTEMAKEIGTAQKKYFFRNYEQDN